MINIRPFAIALLLLLSLCVKGEANVSDSYRLTPGDLIEVKVFQEPDMETKARLSGKGTASMPLLGEVLFGGLTVQEAVQHLETLWEKDYLVDPQVSLVVVEYSKKRFSVLGQVEKPGYYDMPDEGRLNILQAVAMAGGYTQKADIQSVVVRRMAGSRERTYKINLVEMGKSRAGNIFMIEPGDTVFLGFSNRRFSVLGQVEKPGFYEIPEGKKITILQAVAMAGGPRTESNREQVVVTRKVDNRERKYTLDIRERSGDPRDKSFEIRPDDTIHLAFAKRRFSVLGQVNKPGFYEIPEDQEINILQAVAMAGGYTRIADVGKVTVKRKVNGREKVFRVDAKRMARDEDAEAFKILPGDSITVNESIF